MCQLVDSKVFLCTQVRKRASSLIFSCDDTNPTLRTPFSLKSDLKALFPKTFPLRIKASTCTFGEHKSHSSAYSILKNQRESLKAARESTMIVQRNKSQKAMEKMAMGYILKRREKKVNSALHSENIIQRRWLIATKHHLLRFTAHRSPLQEKEICEGSEVTSWNYIWLRWGPHKSMHEFQLHRDL